MKNIINRTPKGFTLIELLVVIAIIGILASIVLVSLNSARAKGKDTRIISDVNEVRTQIEAEASSGGAYAVGSGDCVTALVSPAGSPETLNTTSNNCATLVSDASNNGGAIVVRGNASSGSSFTAYAIYSNLSSNSSSYYCVDSTGNNKTLTAAPSGSAC